jgi:hypothetical protein
MDLAAPSQSLPKVVQVGHKQFRIPLSSGRRDQQCASSPVERSRHMPLLIAPRRDDFRLMAANHPRAADLGIEMDIDFVLENNRLVRQQARDQVADRRQFPSELRIDRTHDRAGTSPDKTKPREAATDGLAAFPHAGLPGQHLSQRLARPATAKVTEVPRRPGQQPLGNPREPERHPHPFGVLIEHSGHAASAKPLDSLRDQVKAAEHDPPHFAVGETVGEKEQDLGAMHDASAVSASIDPQQILAILIGKSDNAFHGAVLLSSRDCATTSLGNSPSFAPLRLLTALRNRQGTI